MTKTSDAIKPYPMQDRVADRIVKQGGLYVMWGMGLGKTLATILAIKRVGMPTIVMAPLNAATITWPNELEKWAPELTFCILHGSSKNHLARKAHLYDVIILNFEGLPWWYRMAQQQKFKLQKYFVVWDEASMLKNSTTKRWGILDEARPIWSPYRVSLSGTPRPKDLEDLWAQYHLIDDGKALGRDLWQFRSRWFDWNKKTYTSTPKIGAAEDIYKRIKPITDRVGDQDWMNLPKTSQTDVVLDLPPSLRKTYQELEKDFMLQFPEGIAEANSSAVLTSKLRQFLQGGVYVKEDIGMESSGEYSLIHDLKVKALREIFNSACGSPIMVAIQFKFEYHLIRKEFGDVPSIHGGVSSTTMKKHVDDWNAMRIPLLVVHPRSVAYSLNMQFGGHTVVWMALPWELDLYEQLARRLQRPGQRSPYVHIIRIMLNDTIDSQLVKMLRLRGEEQQELFDYIGEK